VPCRMDYVSVASVDVAVVVEDQPSPVDPLERLEGRARPNPRWL